MSAMEACRAAERMWNRIHWQQCFDFEELDSEPFPIPAAPAFVRFSGDTPARWQRPETLLAEDPTASGPPDVPSSISGLTAPDEAMSSASTSFSNQRAAQRNPGLGSALRGCQEGL